MALRLAAASLAAAACCASVVTTPCIALAANSLLRTVALTGQPAPGANGGVFAAFQQTPSFNEAGQTAFSATLQILSNVVTTDNDTGIWSEGSGALMLVAHEDSPAPGTPSGVLFNTLSVPLLNDQGQTGFVSNLRGAVTAENDGGIWSELNGPLALAVREGDQPGGVAAGATFSNLTGFRLAEEHVIFTGRMPNGPGGVASGNDSGIWRGDGVATELVAREGSQAPGAPAGAVFFDVASVSPVAGAGGHVAFRSQLLTGAGGVTATNDVGVWSTGGGSLALVAREGSPAPGVSPAANFEDFGFNPPSINSLGRVAFPGTLQLGASGTGPNDSGYWSQGSDGVLKLIAREGSPAPGASGINFAHMAGPIAINEPGQTAFLGALVTGAGGVTAANDQGVWVERDGQLTLFVREGAQAPGAGPGVNFLFTARSTPTLVLNDAGRVAMHSFLTGAGVNSTNDSGIWAEDLTGMLRLIVRRGDLLEVAPGDFRTVNSLNLHRSNGINSDQGSGFNDAGQVAFIATFTNGTSGVVVSNLATVPEPSALALAAACAVAGVGLIRRNDHRRHAGRGHLTLMVRRHV